MATRCNIIVKNGKSITYLYRHWDGYAACTGADIARHLIAANFEAGAFLAAMLNAKRGGDGHDKDRAQYELTNDTHGDIEWCYRVEFNTRSKGCKVGCGSRSLSAGEEAEDAVRKSIITGTFGDFVAMVNAEIAEANQRLHALAAKHAMYAECDDFESVNWEGTAAA